MKKLFTFLVLLMITQVSFAKLRQQTDFNKTLAFQIFWNDSLSIESYTSNSDFCLDYRYKDVLTDGVEVITGRDFYQIYSPKLKTTFTVRPVKNGTYLGYHMIWLLSVVRTHQSEEFSFGLRGESNLQ